MTGLIIYLIGIVFALIISLRLMYKEPIKTDIQYDMLVPACLLSWVFVVLALWKLRNKVF